MDPQRLNELIEQRKAQRKEQAKRKSRVRINSVQVKEKRARTLIKRANELIEGNIFQNAIIYFEIMMEAEYHYPVFRRVPRHNLLPVLTYLAWGSTQTFLYYKLFFVDSNLRYREDQKRFKGIHNFLVRHGLAEKAKKNGRNQNLYWLTTEGKAVGEFLLKSIRTKYADRHPNIVQQFKRKGKLESIKYYRVAKAVRELTKTRKDQEAPKI